MTVIPFCIQAFHYPLYLNDSTATLSRLPMGPSFHEVHATDGMELRAKSSSDDSDRKKKGKGVYARPSAAIERGSGFFVPGLEGSRVRILFGLVVLLLNYINISLLGGVDVAAMSALGFSGNVSSFFGILLLIQGSVEFAKENGLGVGNFDASLSKGKSGRTTKDDGATSISNDNTDDSKYLEQVISPSLNEIDTTVTEAISWVAASYVALTIPATHVMLLELSDRRESNSGTILYSLGNFLEKKSPAEVQEGINAAIKTVHESKGGRVSIPSTHPSSIALLPEGNRRCILLQKVQLPQSDGNLETDRKLCLLVGSDQLLQAYSKNDLKWLGNLGKYLANHI